MIKRNLRLTVRDIELMNDLYDSNFLSFYQIHEKHFPENKKPTVYNRLSKLVSANLITSVNINLIAYHRRGEFLGVIYQLTKEGLKRLQDFNMRGVIELNPVPLNLNCLYHDLLLTDVLRLLKRTLKLTTMITGNQTRIPDAVLFDPMTNKNIALELELTAKSESRYRDIVLSYRTSNEFDSVLYIVKDESIQRKIGGVITGFNSRYELNDDTDKFKFMTLAEILNSTKEKENELQA